MYLRSTQASRSLLDEQVLVVGGGDFTVPDTVADLGPEHEELVAERGRDDREVLRLDLLVQRTPGVGLLVERLRGDLAHLLVHGLLGEERRVVRGTGAD